MLILSIACDTSFLTLSWKLTKRGFCDAWNLKSQFRDLLAVVDQLREFNWGKDGEPPTYV